MQQNGHQTILTKASNKNEFNTENKTFNTKYNQESA